MVDHPADYPRSSYRANALEEESDLIVQHLIIRITTGLSDELHFLSFGHFLPFLFLKQPDDLLDVFIDQFAGCRLRFRGVDHYDDEKVQSFTLKST